MRCACDEQVWKADAERAVHRLARTLNWPRVRLLFIGHREAPEASAEEAGAAAVEATEAAAAAAAPPPGCRFALLDRDLLWLIAEWLVMRDVNDDSCE